MKSVEHVGNCLKRHHDLRSHFAGRARFLPSLAARVKGYPTYAKPLRALVTTWKIEAPRARAPRELPYAFAAYRDLPSRTVAVACRMQR